MVDIKQNACRVDASHGLARMALLAAQRIAQPGLPQLFQVSMLRTQSLRVGSVDLGAFAR